jgi:hypothetical protein
MYDHSEYEAELRSDGSIETRLRRGVDKPEPIRVMVIGPNVEEVSELAKTIRGLLKNQACHSRLDKGTNNG